MNNYYVIAKHWDNEIESQTWYIAGEFTEFMNARLFQKAYNEYYNTKTIVVEGKDIMKVINDKLDA